MSRSNTAPGAYGTMGGLGNMSQLGALSPPPRQGKIPPGKVKLMWGTVHVDCYFEGECIIFGCKARDKLIVYLCALYIVSPEVVCSPWAVAVAV